MPSSSARSTFLRMKTSAELFAEYQEALKREIAEEQYAKARADLVSELGGGIANKSKPGPKPKTAPKARKGAKRDPGELDALTEKLGAFIKKNPGQRIEQVRKELGVTTKDLALPVKRLLAAKKVSTKGQKRATTYYPR